MVPSADALNPLSVVLVGRLATVMAAGQIETSDNSRGWRRYQVLRYFCGSELYARMVRMVIEVAGEVRYTITPKGQVDEVYLEGLVPEGQPLVIRIIRDPLSDPSMLPLPFPDADVRFEVFG